MKRFMTVCCAAVLALCGTGCSSWGGSGSSGAAESSQQTQEKKDGLNVVSSESMDPAYTELLTSYFEAINNKDYAAYEKALYPPFRESYDKYLQSKGSSLEQSFREDLCKRFDEDGYESWELTVLQIEYYPEERRDPDGFFKAYANAGILDEDFGERCKKETTEINDILFTLYALYAGDDEPVAVVTNKELYVVKTTDGVYMFG
ncbi:hypothetical protein [Ruminococcus sp.]|uniref:hypothetical protein n=1 Tax=Ruminococcus sp. TaxID=41978 RepID=UPI0025F5F180|nr:hypothetical protein [Ruminococcus sp.]